MIGSEVKCSENYHFYDFIKAKFHGLDKSECVPFHNQDCLNKYGVKFQLIFTDNGEALLLQKF